ncbi:MAG: hypothetical protein ACRDYY_03475 [Acidimicrobiales bacterium]
MRSSSIGALSRPGGRWASATQNIARQPAGRVSRRNPQGLDAHAGVKGYRFENSLGAHRTAIEYGRHVLGEVLDSDDLDEANRLRNRRHSAEYGEIPAAQIGANEIEHFAGVAFRIVNVVAAELARNVGGVPRPRRPSSTGG